MLQRSLGRLPSPRIVNQFTAGLKRKKMLTLSVDGNISSGKSTLVSKLVDFFPKSSDNNGPNVPTATALPKFKVELIPEPLEKWCDLEGHNLLEMFYTCPEKNNFVFQHYVQLTRLMDTVRRDPEDGLSRNQGSELINPVALKIRVMERSLQNNRYCFLELGKRSGKLHPAEFAVLTEWYGYLEQNMDLKLDVIIYLRTKPETAYTRMKARSRSAEEGCPFEYLVGLHESYEDWLIRKNIGSGGQHVIILDAEKSKEEVGTQCFTLLHDYLKSLTKHIDKTKTGEDESPALNIIPISF